MQDKPITDEEIDTFRQIANGIIDERGKKMREIRIVMDEEGVHVAAILNHDKLVAWSYGNCPEVALQSLLVQPNVREFAAYNSKIHEEAIGAQIEQAVFKALGLNPF